LVNKSGQPERRKAPSYTPHISERFARDPHASSRAPPPALINEPRGAVVNVGRPLYQSAHLPRLLLLLQPPSIMYSRTFGTLVNAKSKDLLSWEGPRAHNSPLIALPVRFAALFPTEGESTVANKKYRLRHRHRRLIAHSFCVNLPTVFQAMSRNYSYFKM
jgi:hypothetical protein